MTALVGQMAPDFTAQALVGREFKDLTLSHYRGKWVVLFFYPKDFTFVCPTEITGFNDRIEDFYDRDAVVLGASTDTVNSHLGWVKSDPRLQSLKFPLLGDVTKRAATDYGVLLEEAGVALRGTFIIDPVGKIQWMQVNNLDVGRSVDEVLRVLEALQTGGLCACDWKQGQPTLEPVV